MVPPDNLDFETKAFASINKEQHILIKQSTQQQDAIIINICIKYHIPKYVEY